MLVSDAGRVLRLTDAGIAALRRGDPRLERRLVDAGMAAWPAGAPAGAGDITVVIPVRDRVASLRRCVGALAAEHRVVVVDDGSRDPAAIARACADAVVIRRDVSGGPAAARNTGLAAVETELVAFLDSDCIPSPGWATRLSGHFRDPAVAAVAPRIRPAGSARSPLDMGARAATVAPGTRVSYVPSAALVVRRDVLGAAAFDEALRYGEDVDLVWRLVDRGRRVRYDPSVVVVHEEPDRFAARLRRRFMYGTSAAPLSRRHPGRLAPAVLRPVPTAVALLLVARRPAPAVAIAAVQAARLSSRLPRRLAARLTVQAVWATWLGMGRAVVTLAGPPALVVAARSRRRRLLVLLLAPVAAQRPTVPALLEDMAYGAGVWAGAIAQRTAAPLRPAWRARPPAPPQARADAVAPRGLRGPKPHGARST